MKMESMKYLKYYEGNNYYGRGLMLWYGGWEMGKFHTIINLPVFSSVLLNDSKVANLHGPLTAGHPQIIFWWPASIGDYIGDKQLDLGCLLYIQ